MVRSECGAEFAVLETLKCAVVYLFIKKPFISLNSPFPGQRKLQGGACKLQGGQSGCAATACQTDPWARLEG